MTAEVLSEEPHADDATRDVDDPPTPPESPDTVDVPAGRWPWFASLLVTVLTFAVYIYFVWRAWNYVVTASEQAEQQDYEQLLNLLDRTQSLATLVLGALLGFGVAAGSKASATAAANKNKDEARRQNDLARRHAAVARHYRRQSATMRPALQEAEALVHAVNRSFERRQADGSRWAPDYYVQRGRVQNGTLQITEDGDHEIISGRSLPTIDPELEDLAAAADRLGRRLGPWSAADGR